MATVRSEFRIGLKDETRQGAASVARSIDSLKVSASRAAAVLGGLGASISAVQLAGFVRGAIDTVDNINRLRQIAGTTAEEFSKLAYAAELADVSNEALANGLRKLGQNMDEAATGSKEARENFARLGVNVTDTEGRLRSTGAVFRDLAQALSRLPDGATKSALAVATLGRAGADLVPLLNEGAEGLARAADEAERFGKVIDTEAALAADQFKDDLTRLKAVSDGLGISLAKTVLPALTDISRAAIEGSKNLGILGASYAAARETFALAFQNSLGDTVLDEKKERLDELIDRLNYLRGEGIVGGIDKAFNDLFGKDRTAEIAAVTAEINKLNAELLAIQKQGENEARQRVESVTRSLASPIGGGDTKSAEKAAKEAQRVAAALQRESDSVRAYLQDYARDREKMFQQEVEQTRARAQALIEEFATPLERNIEKLQEINKLLGSDNDTYGRAAIEAFNELNPEIDTTTEKAKELDKTFAAMGATFSSAFEDAIFSGDKFGNVLKGLAEDLARLVLRKTVIDPIVNGLESLFSTNGGGGSGIGFAIGNLLGSLFSNANGGLYRVAGSGAGERPVAFTAQPGEYVAVGHGRPGGGDIQVINVGAAPQRTERRQVNGKRQLVQFFSSTAYDATSEGALSALGISPPLVSR